MTMAEEVLVVFVIALIFCGEYYFGIIGAFQSQSSFRGATHPRQQHDEHQIVRDTLNLVTQQAQLDNEKGNLKLPQTNNLLPIDAQVQHDSRKNQSKVKNVKSMTPSNEANMPFCVPWETNMDEWWTRHSDWFVSSEDHVHQCFSPMKGEKAAFFRKIYDIQFHGECSRATTKPVRSSGWAADIQYVADGLKYAYETGVPAQTRIKRPVVDDRKDPSSCESNDVISCYFLNATSCAGNQAQDLYGLFMSAGYEMNNDIGRWLLEYATRAQTWLRRKVYEFAKTIQIETPCAVMHVHRSDIVLHGEFSRKYRQIQEYIDALPDDSTKNILLLTDEQNAVDEAKTLHADFNWMIIEKPRHRGVGWNKQVS